MVSDEWLQKCYGLHQFVFQFVGCGKISGLLLFVWTSISVKLGDDDSLKLFKLVRGGEVKLCYSMKSGCYFSSISHCSAKTSDKKGKPDVQVITASQLLKQYNLEKSSFNIKTSKKETVTSPQSLTPQLGRGCASAMVDLDDIPFCLPKKSELAEKRAKVCDCPIGLLIFYSLIRHYHEH